MSTIIIHTLFYGDWHTMVPLFFICENFSTPPPIRNSSSGPIVFPFFSSSHTQPYTLSFYLDNSPPTPSVIRHKIRTDTYLEHDQSFVLQFKGKYNESLWAFVENFDVGADFC